MISSKENKNRESNTYIYLYHTTLSFVNIHIYTCQQIRFIKSRNLAHAAASLLPLALALTLPLPLFPL